MHFAQLFMRQSRPKIFLLLFDQIQSLLNQTGIQVVVTRFAAPTSEPTNTPTPNGPPTIASDQADYPPGGLVTLTGTNWQGDSEVRIVVNDDIGQTWRRDVTVTVAADGTIYDSFNFPSYFVAPYRVAA